jgi:hypothetical protein
MNKNNNVQPILSVAPMMDWTDILRKSKTYEVSRANSVHARSRFLSFPFARLRSLAHAEFAASLHSAPCARSEFRFCENAAALREQASLAVCRPQARPARRPDRTGKRLDATDVIRNANGENCEFRLESFSNTHALLTIGVSFRLARR